MCNFFAYSLALAVVEARLALAGTAWEVAYFFEPAERVAVLPGTRLTTNFLADRYAGSGGCNWYLGTYAVDTEQMRLNSPATTVIECADEAVNAQEARFFNIMANTIAYAVEGDQLIAYTSDAQRLATYNPAAPTPFEGTPWSLKFMASGETVAPLLPFTEVTAVFADGQLTGSGGCNDYRAPFTRADRALTFGAVDVAETVCSEPAGVMEQEKIFLETLAEVAAVEQVGGVLTLLDANYAPLMLLGAP
jgi:heat shock protein HslJ